MSKRRETFHKRHRERVLREKAQRKRQRREQRRNERKDSPVGIPEPSPIEPMPAEVALTSGDNPQG